MHLMTLSQILHFKLDCDTLEFFAYELKSKGFQSHINQFLKPFQLSMQQKRLKVECTFEYAGEPLGDNRFEQYKSLICLDFKIYDCILF